MFLFSFQKYLFTPYTIIEVQMLMTFFFFYFRNLLEICLSWPNMCFDNNIQIRFLRVLDIFLKCYLYLPLTERKTELFSSYIL